MHNGRQVDVSSVKQRSTTSLDGGGSGNSPDRWNPDTGPLEGVVIAGRGGSKRAKKSKEAVAAEPVGDGAELGVARPPPSDFYTKRFRATRG